MACCSIPFFLVGSTGLFGLSFLTGKLEVIIIATAVFVVALGFYLKGKKPKHGNACSIDCECGKGGKKLC